MISVPKSCVAQSDKKLGEGVDDNLWKFQNLKILLTTEAYILFLHIQSDKIMIERMNSLFPLGTFKEWGARDSNIQSFNPTLPVTTV